MSKDVQDPKLQTNLIQKYRHSTCNMRMSLIIGFPPERKYDSIHSTWHFWEYTFNVTVLFRRMPHAHILAWYSQLPWINMVISQKREWDFTETYHIWSYLSELYVPYGFQWLSGLTATGQSVAHFLYFPYVFSSFNNRWDGRTCMSTILSG